MIKIDNEYVYNKDFDYVTGNLEVLAYLHMMGIKADKMTLYNDRYMFVFERTDALLEAIRQFKMDVKVQAYIANSRQIKDYIHQARRDDANADQTTQASKTTGQEAQ